MNGIDEILHNINLDDDYSEPLTRAEQKRILSIINSKTGIAPKKKKRHIARTLLIAACVTAFLAATTALAAYIIELENIGNFKGAEPNHKWHGYIDGKWTLKWNYSSEKNPDMRELSVNIPMECEERNITVTDITLSPLSAQFIVRCELTEDDEAAKATENDRAGLDIFSSVGPYVYDYLSVKMKDGTIIDQQNAKPFRTGDFPEGENCMILRYYMRFNNIVEMDDIEGVIVNGVEYPIE